jgi:hypothetical protein
VYGFVNRNKTKNITVIHEHTFGNKHGDLETKLSGHLENDTTWTVPKLSEWPKKYPYCHAALAKSFQKRIKIVRSIAELPKFPNDDLGKKKGNIIQICIQKRG